MMRQPAIGSREALRQSIAADEARLKSALHELSHAVRARTDVGHFARQHPYTWLGAAFTLGLLWGMGSKR